jgi:hypothetical protein
MLISFFEKSLLMPVIDGNADVLHKQVINALSNNQHTEQKSFIFSVVRSPKIHPSQLVHVRGMALPDFCNPQIKQIEFPQGQQLDFNLRMCLTMRRLKTLPDGTQKTVEFYEKPAQSEQMLRNLLLRHGFELNRLASFSKLSITFTATVTDGYKAALAYVGGIGRKKVFGNGMLRLAK